MQDEMVDIVDENNTVLHHCLKREAHDKGLLHRTILAEVIDSKGNWLLVKQSSSRQDAGQYVSPVGGHIRTGESEKEALKREAFEELGLTVFTYKFIGKGIFNRHILNRYENHLFILYEIYSDQEPKLNHESASFRRFTTDELKKEMIENPLIFGDAWWFAVKKFYPKFYPE
jgi:isopentenyl-diphosphate Delta-isomerase